MGSQISDSISADQPYASARAPVCARNLVASSQPLAVQAGVDALRRGGNAVDAALATAITLTVVEPNNNGVGSDAFAILWDGATLHGLNASGRAPTGVDLQKFGNRKTVPALGWGAVTVPGAVSAWVALSERFGRLRFAELFEAAIHYARDGFQVGPKTAYYWHRAAQTYADFPHFVEHFLPAPAAGAVFRRPDLAHTLERICESNGEAFYRGELAMAMDTAARDEGGALRASDLAEHQCDWVTPTAQDYRDVTLHEIPPNGQGLAAQIALGILRHLEAPDPDTAAGKHVQIEAMKIAIRAAFDHFADPRSMRVAPEELLAPGMLESLARQIDDHAAPLPPVALPTSQDTVYLTTADADGMMVSFIQSNYMGFGSGVVIPKTGIALQNRGRGFSLEPGHPNQLAPGKRPFHTIIPGFVTGAGKPLLSFGVMGGHMQHQGHVQMVNRLFDAGQNPQAASDAPRWHVYEDFSVGLEVGTPEAVLEDLAGRGHDVRFDTAEHVFGGAQLIQRLADGYAAGSDHRKEGQAAGF
ncbi:MAG: gamma-glutamyltransferase family protein [Pseudomonadota bacterium]